MGNLDCGSVRRHRTRSLNIFRVQWCREWSSRIRPMARSSHGPILRRHGSRGRPIPLPLLLLVLTRGNVAKGADHGGVTGSLPHRYLRRRGAAKYLMGNTTISCSDYANGKSFSFTGARGLRVYDSTDFSVQKAQPLRLGSFHSLPASFSLLSFLSLITPRLLRYGRPRERSRQLNEGL